MKTYYYRNIRSPEQIRADMAAARAKRSALDARLRAQDKAERGSILKRARAYLKAEAGHAVHGAAPAAVVAQRIETCLRCPKRVDEMDAMKDEGGVGFCSACGCPGSRRSQLSVKLTIAGATCPLGKFSPVDGVGGNAGTAVEALRGLVATLAAAARKVVRGLKA